jgi:hypothetical protein
VEENSPISIGAEGRGPPNKSNITSAIQPVRPKNCPKLAVPYQTSFPINPGGKFFSDQPLYSVSRLSETI